MEGPRGGEWSRDGARWRRVQPRPSPRVLRRVDAGGSVVYEGPEDSAPLRPPSQPRVEGVGRGASTRVAARGVAISVKGLSKTYGELAALKDVSLEVKGGEMFGLLGPNGAGKTTLIEILCGMRDADSGDALIAGHSVRDEITEVRKKLGIVFQLSTLDPDLTAVENLRIHGQLYKMQRADIEARIPELLEFAGLTDRKDEPIKTYSGGLRRRLEVVRSVIHRPAVLLLDEPTVALDPQSRHVLWDYILRLREETGMTVLLTTHYMEEAGALCDRIAIVDHGTVSVVDTPRSLKERLGGDRLELELEKSAEVRCLEVLRATPNVLEVAASNGTLKIRLREPSVSIPLVLETLTAHGSRVLKMTHQPTSMDDVFLTHTGRAPREKRRRARGLDAWIRDKLVRRA